MGADAAIAIAQNPGLAKNISDIFSQDGKQIGDLVKDFDFQKMSLKDETADDFLHIDLAPSFGKLNNKALQDMDDELKIMIAGTTKVIGVIPKGQRTWEAVMSAFMQNVFLEPDGDAVSKSDSFIKNSSSDFKTDGSPADEVVQEVAKWFKNLINDADVLSTSAIDINVLGQIVAQSGATVDSFENFFAKHEVHKKTIVDIGVLRYPDMDHPYFKVYRIKLDAWSDCTRVLFHQNDQNGITGEFTKQLFKPRSSVIQNMTAKARNSAISMANNLFD